MQSVHSSSKWCAHHLSCQWRSSVSDHLREPLDNRRLPLKNCGQCYCRHLRRHCHHQMSQAKGFRRKRSLSCHRGPRKWKERWWVPCSHRIASFELASRSMFSPLISLPCLEQIGSMIRLVCSTCSFMRLVRQCFCCFLWIEPILLNFICLLRFVKKKLPLRLVWGFDHLKLTVLIPLISFLTIPCWPFYFESSGRLLRRHGTTFPNWNKQDGLPCAHPLIVLKSMSSERYITRRLSGLGVWFSLRVREVPGSNPGWARVFCHVFFIFLYFTISFHEWPECSNNMAFPLRL